MKFPIFLTSCLLFNNAMGGLTLMGHIVLSLLVCCKYPSRFLFHFYLWYLKKGSLVWLPPPQWTVTEEKIAKTFKICHLWTLFGQQGQHQVFCFVSNLVAKKGPAKTAVFGNRTISRNVQENSLVCRFDGEYLLSQQAK